jgi:hypothetical protein
MRVSRLGFLSKTWGSSAEPETLHHACVVLATNQSHSAIHRPCASFVPCALARGTAHVSSTDTLAITRRKHAGRVHTRAIVALDGCQTSQALDGRSSLHVRSLRKVS